MLEDVYQFLRAIVVPLAAIIMGGIGVRKLAKKEAHERVQQEIREEQKNNEK